MNITYNKIILRSILIVVYTFLTIGSLLSQTKHIYYSTYVRDEGWTEEYTDGTIFTLGMGKCIEAIKLYTDIPNTSISYKTHLQDKGWSDWAYDNIISGFPGKGLRMEAIIIRLNNSEYTLEYRTRIQNNGWMKWTKEGDIAGTTGKSLKIEDIEIRLNKKETPVIPSNFIGKYKYFENVGSHSWNYTLEVFSIANSYSVDSYYANLAIDGHMSVIRIKCKAKIYENKIEFYFYKTMKGDMYSNNIYQKEDLLFELENINDTNITNWFKLQPMLEENNPQGGIRFKKI